MFCTSKERKKQVNACQDVHSPGYTRSMSLFWNQPALCLLSPSDITNMQNTPVGVVFEGRLKQMDELV